MSRNAHCSERDKNSTMQSERLQTGTVCYNLRCRSVAVADDNKLVAVPELQSMVQQTVSYRLSAKCVVHS